MFAFCGVHNVSAPTPVAAQSRAKKKPKRVRKRKRKKRARQERKPTSAPLGSGVDSEEVEEGGGEKVKVFRFTGLDVSGRLRSPQMLYFMNRVRAEFNRPRLPHRSFIPELKKSAEGEPF